jgi:hypothetical protein
MVSKLPKEIKRELPTKVRIGGKDYEIIKTNLAFTDSLQGQISYGELKIRLEESLPEQNGEEVLLHEIIHGVFNHMRIEQDEELVEKLGNGLYQVISDNPHIFGGIKLT